MRAGEETMIEVIIIVVMATTNDMEFRLGSGSGSAYWGWESFTGLGPYREVIIETQRECGYIPGYVWNPNWQRWESSWVLHCQQVGR